MLCASVNELQAIALQVIDDHSLLLSFGSNRQSVSDGHRRDLVFIPLITKPRAVGLSRESAELLIHVIRFSEEDSGKQLEIESNFTDPFIRQRPVQVNYDFERCSDGFDLDHITEIKVGIDDGVEPFPVFLRVGVFHPYADLLPGAVNHSFPDLWNRLPLSWGRLQTQITVGGDAQPVLNDAY